MALRTLAEIWKIIQIEQLRKQTGDTAQTDVCAVFE